jgi:hypothetical protein
MIAIERIPNFCDFNREPMKWVSIEEFLADKFLSTWFEIVENITKIDLVKMKYRATNNEFELVLFTKDSRRHIASIYLQEGDKKENIIEKIKAKLP